MNLKEKVVLVTGASRGIGRAVAQQFARRDAHVAVHYNEDLDAAKSTLASLAGDSHVIVQANLRKPQSVRALVDEVVKELGTIDVLVNNAGVYTLHSIADVDFDRWQEEWQATLETNLIGAANLTYFVVQHMLQQGGGRIVNVTSRGAFRGEPKAPAYGASKAGMNAMSQSLAKALAPHNIFVYAVAPGFVETDMVRSHLSGPEGDSIRQQSPLGRVARPEEVAETVAYLASDAADYLTGCIIDINGASYLRN